MVKYYLDLCTEETWRFFREAGADVAGFRERHHRLAKERVKPGDILLAYMTGVSRWCGALEVESNAFYDDTPRYDNPDPFPVRFQVKPIVLLDAEFAIPIREPQVWETLSITREFDRDYPYWTGFFRASLNALVEDDGRFLLDLLKRQAEHPKPYPLTDKDKRQLSPATRVPTPDGNVVVNIPVVDDEAPKAHVNSPAVSTGADVRESIQCQAKVARVGLEMGYSIWVPKNDRTRVLELVPSNLHGKFLERLPLNYDDATLRTIEQIDVLWLRGRSMARAFEIEHTTAIYSGLLRMADLLALQPNMDIRLHIVAPLERREQVLREIRRPVFSLLERGPLYEQCSYLSYFAVDQIAQLGHLRHVNDSILVDYEDTGEP